MSQQEDYISTVQDQELPTKYLRYQRARDSGKIPDCNYKCRLHTTNVEDISHVIAGCSHMSARYYLPLRHDKVAKTLLYSHLTKFYPSKNIALSSEPEYIYKENSHEYRWNVSVKTVTKVPHNKPINVNNIVYPCKICHVNINNKDSAAQCNNCQSWVHMKCNNLNHIDYKYLQGSNDPWYYLSCCSNIFPFGTQTNKDFISSITTTNSFSQSTSSDNDKESLLSLKPLSDLALLYNQFNNTSPKKKQ